MRHMTGVGVDVYLYLCMYEGCRCVKHGDSDSDRSSGYVWAAVMDVRGAVISKAFQGRHDRTLYVYTHVLAFVCVCV